MWLANTLKKSNIDIVVDDNLIHVLSLINQNMSILSANFSKKSAYANFIKNMVALESSTHWKFVIDSQESSTIIQICGKAPNYARFIIEITATSCHLKTIQSSIVNPTDEHLKMIQGVEKKESLFDTISHLNSKKIGRLAVVGAVRIFPNLNPLDLHHCSKIQRQLNVAIDTLLSLGKDYLLINGGWCGDLEDSRGVPLFASLFGSIICTEQDKPYLSPITIMPAYGIYDRVNSVSHDLHPTSFLIPGVWGDDSPYLIAASTAVLAFERYGFFTQIEIANALYQHKPVAVIMDSANLTKPTHKEHIYKILKHGYYEQSLMLPDKRIGKYRVYLKIDQAVKWLHQQQ